MNNLYGVLLLLAAIIFSALFLMFVMEIYENIEKGSFEIQSLVLLLLIWPLAKLAMYSCSIISGHKYTFQQSALTYKIGSGFLVLATLIYLYSFSTLAYLILTNASGIPIGLGFAAGLILFGVGAGLIENAKIKP